MRVRHACWDVVSFLSFVLLCATEANEVLRDVKAASTPLATAAEGEVSAVSSAVRGQAVITELRYAVEAVDEEWLVYVGGVLG